MRSSISFLSVLFLSGLVAALAQDVNMQSDSEDWLLLNIENTGTTDKTMVNVIGAGQWGTGIQVTVPGQSGINVSNYTDNGYWNRGFFSEVYQNNGSGATFGMQISNGGGSSNWGSTVYSSGGEGTYNIGVDATASGGNGSENFGIIGRAYGGDTTTVNYAGYFEGNVAITGFCDPCSFSDEKLKTNIRTLEGGLSKVMALKPKKYEMKTEEFKNSINLAKGTRFGLIAQELQSVLPELVHDAAVPPRTTREDMKRDSKKPSVKPELVKFKALNYTGLIPVMLAAMQEQQAQIEALKAEVASLKK